MTKTKVAVLVIALLALLTAGWNMAWRYDEADIRVGGSMYRGRYKVRTHMVTGRVEYLSSYGWTSLH